MYNTWAKVVPVDSLSEGGKPDPVLLVEPPNRTIRGSYRPPINSDEASGSFHSTAAKSFGLMQATSLDSDEVRLGLGFEDGGRNSGHFHPYGRDSGTTRDDTSASLFSPIQVMYSVYDGVLSRFGNYRPVNQVDEIEKFITL